MKFEKPNTYVEAYQKDDFYGKFVIKPLERGFGITLGNSLRRVLLSSLPGAAITNVYIEGAQHEFSSIEGIVEDVTEIVLNLKDVVLTIDSDDPNVEKTMEIIAVGEGQVTARDIICDSDVTIINQDKVIANLANYAKLKMVLVARRGVGYVDANENKRPDDPVGYIPIDSIYTPIKNVKYNVEKILVDNSADHDELIVEITTDGSINPEDAIGMASKIMIEHLEVLVELSEKAMESEFIVEREDKSNTKLLEMSIEELDLSVRSYNSLKRAGISTVGELSRKSEEDMMTIRNLGRKSLKEVKDKLEELGLGLNNY
ncbi:DNA-directed RNA polymerase subunit alpha [Mycoplasmatota bacterium]|nr:DNA-directed RNA polymerase subunit alpha [Mycoplasmatota bacterium]